MKIKQNHFQTKQEFTNNKSKTGISPEYAQFTDHSVIGKATFISYIYIMPPPLAPSFLVLLTHPIAIPTFIFKSLCQSKTVPSDTSIQQACDQPCLLQTREECPETNSHKIAHTTIYNSHLSRANFPQCLHQFALQCFQICF